MAVTINASTSTGLVQSADTSGEIELQSNGTTALKVNTNEGIQILNCLGVGNATPSTSGAGITFPATASPSSNANTLDDYEEGTWTPTDGSGAGLTFTSVGGSYTKVGRLVTCQFNLNYPSTASTSQASINGLPFASASLSGIDNPIGGFITYTSANITFTVPGGSGGTNFNFWNLAGGQVTNVQLSNANIRMTLIYVAN